MQKILFIGASGMLGKPVALELLRAGFKLTLLARDVEKMQKLFPNAPVAKGDVLILLIGSSDGRTGGRLLKSFCCSIIKEK
jgi:NADP-dependent 3-hydroxy acid dehydrogenase YdfG